MTVSAKSLRTKPTDIAICLAMALKGRDKQYADEISFQLRKLGFTVTSQQIAARLGRMSREQHPCVDRTIGRWSGATTEYSLTHFGRKLLTNTYQGRI
jgi:DNA-binding HxlR family transcriptional regulator